MRCALEVMVCWVVCREDAVMAELPGGTVSLLFSDIEGSTVLLS